LYCVIFKKRICVNTPIITGSDAEGAVKCFTALPFDGTPRTEDGKVNYKKISLAKKRI
jgi:asparaginyl-tRNA synthetase